jgi:hypothetical protein
VAELLRDKILAIQVGGGNNTLQGSPSVPSTIRSNLTKTKTTILTSGNALPLLEFNFVKYFCEIEEKKKTAKQRIFH